MSLSFTIIRRDIERGGAPHKRKQVLGFKELWNAGVEKKKIIEISNFT